MENMREIINKLKKASLAYYTIGYPIMSDQEYDLLYEQLQRSEEETGTVYDDSCWLSD